jgi:hypothetical protein
LYKITFEEISIIVENQINLILDERNPILEKISDDIINALLRESAYEVGHGNEMFLTTYFEYRANILEFYLQLSLDKNTKIKLIDWVNNYFNYCHNFLFDNAQRRLSRHFTFLPLDCLEDVALYPELLKSIQRLISDYRFKDTKYSTEFLKILQENYYNTSIEINDQKAKYEKIAYLTNNKTTKMLDDAFNKLDGMLNHSANYITKILARMVWERYSSYNSILMNDLDLLIEDYEKYLQSSLKEVKQKQDTCYMVMTNKYVQVLDKIDKLETDLKYQQEYIKQH